MSAPHGQTIIAGYLRRLDGELRGLPRRRREEIVADISEHIADARSERGDTGESDADLLGLLDRLGEPAAIAAEARERFGVESPGRAQLADIVALILLGPGNLVVPFLSWFVGALMIWQSRAWTPAQKRRSLYVPLFIVLVSVSTLMIGFPPYSEAFFIAGPIAVPVLCTGYLAWHIGRRLPRIAWVAAAMVTAIITLPVVAASLPVTTRGSVDGLHGGCSTFHGTVDYGMGANVAITLSYCVTRTHVYATRYVACPATSHGILAINVETCNINSQSDDGSMWVRFGATSRAVTSATLGRHVSCLWIIKSNGLLFDPAGC